MAEPEAMPADAIVHEMDTPESEEDACSWRALMETLAGVGDPPKRGSARSDDVTSEEPSIVAPFVRPDAVPARWGLHVSGAVHGGWVKQTSPACAAAVVAGAWNALACGGDRHAPGALRQTHVVAHLEDVLSEAIAAKRARFERMLGAPIGDFMDALSAAIAVDPSGKTLGGVSKGEPGMKRPEVMRIVTELIASRGEAELAERESSMDPDHEHETLVDADEDPDGGAYPPGEPAPMSSFGALARLAREDAARRTADANDDLDADAASADDEDEEPDEDIENDENADENGASSSINVSANSEPCEEDLIAALVDLDDAFGVGDGEVDWRAYVLNRTHWVTETNCNWDGTDRLVEYNDLQCDRLTGASQAIHGKGSLHAFASLPSIERFSWWNTYNAKGDHANNANKYNPSLIDQDGTLRPAGRAYLDPRPAGS